MTESDKAKIERRFIKDASVLWPDMTVPPRCIVRLISWLEKKGYSIGIYQPPVGLAADPPEPKEE